MLLCGRPSQGRGPLRIHGLRKLVLLTAFVAAVVAIPTAQTKPTPVTGGVFTSVNEGTDGTGTCKNGNPQVNCNQYFDKRYVWLNGGPAKNSLSPTDGKFFFAVLEPGGQPDPNDCASFPSCTGLKNLSDDYDCWQNRAFKLTNGEVTNYPFTGGTPATPLPANCFAAPVIPFTHWLDSGALPLNRGAPNNAPPLIRLFPYANTTNPGGVYIMAVCSLTTHVPPNIVPSDCKYDAFKVPNADSSAPECLLTATITGPPKQIQITIEDPQSGLESVDYTVTNASVSPDSGPFTTNADGSSSGSADLFVGMVTPFVLTATKTNQALGSRIVVTVNDVGGLKTTCDPVVPAAVHLSPFAAIKQLLAAITKLVTL